MKTAYLRSISSLSRFLGLLLALVSLGVHAHAFPHHSNPAADASLTTPPDKIEMWFNSPLEPMFSHVTVKDPDGKVVSKNDHIDKSNPKLLTAELQASAKGKYQVHWNVVSVDGHSTQGDYSFTVK
jgi:methionine-rich copper-binding protein CopC